jgi:hypothetical protein
MIWQARREEVWRADREDSVEMFALFLNCYTNVDRCKALYKHSLVLFYYANRLSGLIKLLIVSSLGGNFP